jgi:hypothetical protein
MTSIELFPSFSATCIVLPPLCLNIFSSFQRADYCSSYGRTQCWTGRLTPNGNSSQPPCPSCRGGCREMPNPNECRDHAFKCSRLAETFADGPTRQLFQTWLRLGSHEQPICRNLRSVSANCVLRNKSGLIASDQPSLNPTAARLVISDIVQHPSSPLSVSGQFILDAI